MWPAKLVYIMSYYWHMPLNKCAYHIRHIYISNCTSTILYIQALQYCTHPSKSINCNFIYHTTAKYMPAINTSLKCHIYAIYLTCINWERMPMYMPNMNSLASTKWPGALYTDWWQCRMMMQQYDYIYWVGHMARSVKNRIRFINIRMWFNINLKWSICLSIHLTTWYMKT